MLASILPRNIKLLLLTCTYCLVDGPRLPLVHDGAVESGKARAPLKLLCLHSARITCGPKYASAGPQPRQLVGKLVDLVDSAKLISPSRSFNILGACDVMSGPKVPSAEPDEDVVLDNSSLAIVWWPQCEAASAGVVNPPWHLPVSAALDNSSSTIARWPFCIAMNNGVAPSLARLILAPLNIINSTIASWPN